ncbi:uncharacterized protein IL334_006942 [Kwoniella shivajii]|uniref:BRCT domain-containing protein n=1 Tax=Kwoniella shivajii TaxID=564305 RepID=A0ABZ1DAF9_9TREE|nr:hypothetical protein IL334_006942 [Kwoniella shivajii]
MFDRHRSPPLSAQRCSPSERKERSPSYVPPYEQARDQSRTSTNTNTNAKTANRGKNGFTRNFSSYTGSFRERSISPTRRNSSSYHTERGRSPFWYKDRSSSYRVTSSYTSERRGLFDRGRLDNRDNQAWEEYYKYTRREREVGFGKKEKKTSCYHQEKGKNRSIEGWYVPGPKTNLFKGFTFYVHSESDPSKKKDEQMRSNGEFVSFIALIRHHGGTLCRSPCPSYVTHIILPSESTDNREITIQIDKPGPDFSSSSLEQKGIWNRNDIIKRFAHVNVKGSLPTTAVDREQRGRVHVLINEWIFECVKLNRIIEDYDDWEIKGTYDPRFVEVDKHIQRPETPPWPQNQVLNPPQQQTMYYCDVSRDPRVSSIRQRSSSNEAEVITSLSSQITNQATFEVLVNDTALKMTATEGEGESAKENENDTEGSQQVIVEEEIKPNLDDDMKLDIDMDGDHCGHPPQNDYGDDGQEEDIKPAIVDCISAADGEQSELANVISVSLAQETVCHPTPHTASSLAPHQQSEVLSASLPRGNTPDTLQICGENQHTKAESTTPSSKLKEVSVSVILDRQKGVFAKGLLPISFHVLGSERERRLMEVVITRAGGGLISPSTTATFVLLPLSPEESATDPSHVAVVDGLAKDKSRAAISADWVHDCIESDTLIPLDKYFIRKEERQMDIRE